MHLSDIKNNMMELWEKTFHYSKEYIQLIFDEYFDEKYIAYHEENGRIVSCLLGIPYQFGYGSNKLHGLYLCGMATEEKFRHKGLMSELIEEINIRARENFDFTFLVPVSDLNADYYRRRGYFNSFFHLEERFTSIHDFQNDYLISLADSDEKIVELKKKIFFDISVVKLDDPYSLSAEKIIEFILQQEKKPRRSANLCHTPDSLKLILKEADITGSYVFYASDKEGNISGVAFAEKGEMKRLNLKAVYVDDKCSYYSLLHHIKKYFPEYSMSVFVTSEHLSSPAIIDEVYGAENPMGQDLETLFGLLETQFDITKLMQPSGMLKLLNFEGILSYIAAKKDAEFKIYIREPQNPFSEEKIIYIVKNGNLVKEISNKPVLDKNVLNLSVKELSELLLRKKDSNSLIMEAFGIPRLVLEKKLLADKF